MKRFALKQNVGHISYYIAYYITQIKSCFIVINIICYYEGLLLNHYHHLLYLI